MQLATGTVSTTGPMRCNCNRNRNQSQLLAVMWMALGQCASAVQPDGVVDKIRARTSVCGIVHLEMSAESLVPFDCRRRDGQAGRRAGVSDL